VAIYSTRFVSLSVNGVAGSFQVPPAHRAVVMSVIAVAASTSPGSLEVQAGGSYLVISDVPAKQTRHWTDIRFTLYEGEFITAYLPVANTYCSVHGYLFADVAGTKAPRLDYERVDGQEPLPVDEASPPDIARAIA
jgi:hypothetical protein